MTAGMLCIPVGDSFAKLAAETTAHSGVTLAWARFLLGAALVTPLALLLGKVPALTGRFLAAQLLRGLLLSAVIVCIITAVSLVPLADAFGAFFVGPAVATILASTLLAEPVRRIEWAAVVAGFAGVLLIVKPQGTVAPGLIWALAAGCFYGGYLTAVRWTAPVAPPLAQLAGQLCVGAVLLTPLAVWSAPSLSLEAPALLLGSGIASAIANLFAIAALGFARAALLTPLVYCQLIGATVLGWLVFGDLPDLWTTLGLLIIAIAGFSPLLVAERTPQRKV